MAGADFFFCEKESHVWLCRYEAKRRRINSQHEWIRGRSLWTREPADTAAGSSHDVMWGGDAQKQQHTHTQLDSKNTHDQLDGHHSWYARNAEPAWAHLSTLHTHTHTHTHTQTVIHDMSCGDKWQFLPEKMQMATPQATWKVLLLSSSLRVFLLDTYMSVCVCVWKHRQ